MQEYERAVSEGKTALELPASLSEHLDANEVKMVVATALYKLNRIPDALLVFDDVYRDVHSNLAHRTRSLFWFGNCHYRSGYYLIAHKRYEQVYRMTWGLKRMIDLHCEPGMYMATSAY